MFCSSANVVTFSSEIESLYVSSSDDIVKSEVIIFSDWDPICASYPTADLLYPPRGQRTFQLRLHLQEENMLVTKTKVFNWYYLNSAASCCHTHREGNGWETETVHLAKLLVLWQEMAHPAFFFLLFSSCSCTAGGHKPSPSILYEMTFTWIIRTVISYAWVESVTHSHIPFFIHSTHRIRTKLQGVPEKMTPCFGGPKNP